jgi:hypothetical protein
VIVREHSATAEAGWRSVFRTPLLSVLGQSNACKSSACMLETLNKLHSRTWIPEIHRCFGVVPSLIKILICLGIRIEGSQLSTMSKLGNLSH